MYVRKEDRKKVYHLKCIVLYNGLHFHKISVIWEEFMYVITVSNHRIYVCKRPYNPQDPAVA